MPDLLIEIFSEEIPARMQRKAGGDLKRLLTDALVEEGLFYEAARAYWTPRRLCLDLRGLSPRSPDRREVRKGPSVSAPDVAIAGFLRSAGLGDIAEATIAHDTKKGDYYSVTLHHPGRLAQIIIAEILPKILRNFPWEKSMRWGNVISGAETWRWVRPLHSILCLLGTDSGETEVVDFEFAGLHAGRLTYGHRFMGSGKPVKVRNFDDYAAKMMAEKIVLDADRRKDMIVTDARNLCFARGVELVEDEALLEEVSGLAEWPQVLMGQFDEQFLTIPAEIVRLTIRANQKCFVTRKKSIKTGDNDLNSPGSLILSNHFVLVSNIETSDSGAAIVRGNERVVRARLSDALYFWRTDQADIPDLASLASMAEEFDLDLNKPLDQRMARLAKLDVTFHARLGTQAARVKRLAKLAVLIAPLVGADPALARRAAFLAKADLQSDVVGEFPELQGLMGHYYALLQGEEGAVARAIEEHYKPQGSGDSVPCAPVSVALALADKIDMLAGFWLIDEKPTGSKDPYALRRAALGVIRLCLVQEWHIRLLPLFAAAWQNYAEQGNKADASVFEGMAKSLLQFMHERFKVYLKDEGARHDAIEAILSADRDDLLRVARQIEALTVFVHSEEGKNLLAGIKRAVNILTEAGEGDTCGIDPSLFVLEQEHVLFHSVEKIKSEIRTRFGENDFAGALRSSSDLRQPVDDFFEHVLVHDEDVRLRANRLGLLREVQATMAHLADFSKLTLK